jgi:DNA-binding response OmpR family regulator
MADATNPLILLFSDDLLDSSRVVGHARAAGLEVAVIRTLEQAQQLVAARQPLAVILDLHHPKLDVTRWRANLHELVPTMKIIGYGSHVDVARLKEARAAGCDRVMPRSQFVEELPRMTAWFWPSA